MTECNGEPTQDWQPRCNVGIILRHNVRHQDDSKPLPRWITESPDNYATLKRPLPESKTENIYVYDTEYKCDPWDEPTFYDAITLSFNVQAPHPQNQSEAAPKFPTSVTHFENVRTNSDSTRHCNVYTNKRKGENSTGDKTLWSQMLRKRTVDTSSPPPPQTAHATEAPDSNEDTTEWPPPLHLDVIKEFLQHDKDDNYIPLMSAIALKKRRECSSYPSNSMSI